MYNVTCSLTLEILTTFFRLKIALHNYKMEVPKTSRAIFIFKVLWIISTH